MWFTRGRISGNLEALCQRTMGASSKWLTTLALTDFARPPPIPRCAPAISPLLRIGTETKNESKAYSERELTEASPGSKISRLFGVRHLKTLKVVLTETIESLGHAGQVVKVSPGYARNMLIPHHLALPALGKYVTLVNNQLKVARPHLLEVKEDVTSESSGSEEEKLEEIEAILRRLDSGKLVIRRDLASLNSLQLGVTKEDIILEVRRQMGVELADSNLILPKEFTSLGEFEVLLRFPKGLRMPGGKEQLFLKLRIRRK